MQEKNKVTENESLLEVARIVLGRKEGPKKLKSIIEDVRTECHLSKEEMDELAPQFILDFMCSGYFWYYGNDLYGLKEWVPSKTLDSDDFKVSNQAEDQESQYYDMRKAQATYDESGNLVYDNVTDNEKTEEEVETNETSTEEEDILEGLTKK